MKRSSIMPQPQISLRTFFVATFVVAVFTLGFRIVSVYRWPPGLRTETFFSTVQNGLVLKVFLVRENEDIPFLASIEELEYHGGSPLDGAIPNLIEIAPNMEWFYVKGKAIRLNRNEMKLIITRFGDVPSVSDIPREKLTTHSLFDPSAIWEILDLREQK